MYYYIGFAIWFWLVDMVAGCASGSKPRPLVSLLVGITWPVSITVGILFSAEILRRYKALLEVKGNVRPT